MFAVFGSLHLYMRHNYLTEKTPINFEILNRNFEEMEYRGVKEGSGAVEAGHSPVSSLTQICRRSSSSLEQQLQLSSSPSP